MMRDKEWIVGDKNRCPDCRQIAISDNFPDERPEPMGADKYFPKTKRKETDWRWIGEGLHALADIWFEAMEGFVVGIVQIADFLFGYEADKRKRTNDDKR